MADEAFLAQVLAQADRRMHRPDSQINRYRRLVHKAERENIPTTPEPPPPPPPDDAVMEVFDHNGSDGLGDRMAAPRGLAPMSTIVFPAPPRPSRKRSVDPEPPGPPLGSPPDPSGSPPPPPGPPPGPPGSAPKRPRHDGAAEHEVPARTKEDAAARRLERLEARLVKMCTGKINAPSKFVEAMRDPACRVVLVQVKDTFGSFETVCGWVRALRFRPYGIEVGTLAARIADELQAVWIVPGGVPVLDGLGTVAKEVQRLMEARCHIRSDPPERVVIVLDDVFGKGSPGLDLARSRTLHAARMKAVTITESLGKACLDRILKTLDVTVDLETTRSILARGSDDPRWMLQHVAFRGIGRGGAGGIAVVGRDDNANDVDGWYRMLVRHARVAYVSVPTSAVLAAFEAVGDTDARVVVDRHMTHTRFVEPPPKPEDRIGAFAFRPGMGRKAAGATSPPGRRIGRFAFRAAPPLKPTEATVYRMVSEPGALLRVTGATEDVRLALEALVQRCGGIVREYGRGSRAADGVAGATYTQTSYVAAVEASARGSGEKRCTAIAAIADDLALAHEFDSKFVMSHGGTGLKGFFAEIVERTVQANTARHAGARTPGGGDKAVAKTKRALNDAYFGFLKEVRDRTARHRGMTTALATLRIGYDDVATVTRLRGVWGLYLPVDPVHVNVGRDAVLYAAIALNEHPAALGRRADCADALPLRDPSSALDLAAWFGGTLCTYPHFAASVAWAMAWSAIAAAVVADGMTERQIAPFIMKTLAAARTRKLPPSAPPAGRIPNDWLAELGEACPAFLDPTTKRPQEYERRDGGLYTHEWPTVELRIETRRVHALAAAML